MKLNPHLVLLPLGPKGTENRQWICRKQWMCRNCRATGRLNALNATDCTAPIPPPCEWCGKTPICDLKCMGIKVLLASPDVHVVGEPGAGIGDNDDV